MYRQDFNTLADLIPEPMLLVQKNGTIVAANKSFLQHHGFDGFRAPPDAFHLRDIVGDSDEEIDAFLTRCARTADPLFGTLHLRYLNHGSAWRIAGSVFLPRVEDSPAIVLLRFIEQTAAIQQFITLNERIERLDREVAWRRRVETELRDQREWLEVTLTSIGDGVIATDAEAKVVLINPSAEQSTGWQASEALGRPLSDIFVIVNETTRQPVNNPVDKVLQEGVRVGLANHTVLIRKDGTEIPIDDCGAPIRDSNNRLLGAVLVFHEIVERRELEKQLQQKADNLIEADRRKDEFLAMLAHELRNPLAPLRNGVQLLQMTPLSDRQMNVVQVMQRQITHLVRLIDDLLDVARISRGRINLLREPVLLASIVEHTMEILKVQIAEFRGKVAIEPVDNELVVLGDPTRLCQVLVNLLGNAMKYSPRGGTVMLSISREHDHALVAVRDEGMGIDATLIPHVFDLFTQATRSLDRSSGGLGIGLTMVKNIVEMHGGQVWAHSAGIDAGSTFNVRLPLSFAAVKSIPEPGPDAMEAAATQPRQILVVDDNDDSRHTLVQLLEMWGYTTLQASDGEGCLAVAQNFKPELILLDIGLPEMTGYEVARHLRELGAAKYKMAALTGYGSAADRKKAFDAGFDEHFTKPVDLHLLKEWLDS